MTTYDIRNNDCSVRSGWCYGLKMCKRNIKGIDSFKKDVTPRWKDTKRVQDLVAPCLRELNPPPSLSFLSSLGQGISNSCCHAQVNTKGSSSRVLQIAQRVHILTVTETILQK